MIITEMLPEHLEQAYEVVAAFKEQHGALARVEIPKYRALPSAKFYVCLMDQRVVGVLGYIPDQEGAQGVYWPEFGYVHPAYRRRGVGTALWDRVEADLKEKGCRKVYIDIGNEDEHEDAIRMYKARGYVKEAAIPDFWSDGEDLVIYAKRLVPHALDSKHQA